MFEPLEIEHDKHVAPRATQLVSSWPVTYEGIDHNHCRLDGNVWKDSYGFVCSRCTYKKGVPG